MGCATKPPKELSKPSPAPAKTPASVHAGWVRKLSRKGVFGGRCWRRRWAVVGDDGSRLQVFASEEEAGQDKKKQKKPIKTVSIARGLVVRQLYAEDEGAMERCGIDTSDGSDLAFLFELAPPKNGRALFFACETETELEDWIEVIEAERESRADGAATPGRRDRFDSVGLRDLGCNPEATHNTWNNRLQAVLDLPPGQNQLLGVATVASDFVGEASKFVAAVVDEYVVPRPLQKFPPLLHTDLGHHGYERDEHAAAIYFENDVLYQVLNVPAASVVLQTKRDFVGADKLSVTAALQERLVAQLLRSVDHAVAKKLRTALTVVISHAGFRVSATAVLPVSPGTLAYGVGCAEPDQRLCNLINRAMSQLGFGSHPVGRRLMHPDCDSSEEEEDESVNPCTISAGINVGGHRGEDGRFYLTNLDGICPADLLPIGSASDHTECSTEDAAKAATAALGTCFLRPELVSSYTQHAGEVLSANSFLDLSEPNEEARLVNEEFEWAAGRAGRYLREAVIPQFMEKLNKVEMMPCSGAALTAAMHKAGINMRFLGVLAGRATLPHVHDLLVVEMVSRQAKQLLTQNLLRQQLSVHLQGDGLAKTTVELWLREHEIERREVAVEYFNLLLGETEASVSYWTNVLVPAVRHAYGVDVERCEVRRVALACALQMACGLELRAGAAALKTWRQDFVRPQTRGGPDAAGALGMLGIAAFQSFEGEPEDADAMNANTTEDEDEDARAAQGLLTGGDFGRWSDVLHQPWLTVPYTFAHELLTGGDLSAAVIQPRRLDSEAGEGEVCAAGGTAFARECLSWVGDGAAASLRKTFTACCRCLRREEQLRLAGDLALAAAADGSFEEALSLIEEVEVRLLRTGWEDGEVARLMLAIAQVHHAHQNSDVARQYCSRGLQAATVAWGARHPLLLELHGLMAEIDLESGDLHSCLAQRQACLSVASASLGLQHVATACYANAVGLDCLRLAAGEASEAVGHHQRALAVYENAFGRAHAGTAACAFYLAAALCRAGDYTQAAEMANYAADVRRTLSAAAEKDQEEVLDLLHRESLAQIAELADARGDFSAASAALRELMELPPAMSKHAEAAVEAATAATLRVCLRTQISFELAAAISGPSTAVATLFRQAAAARGQQDEERTESAQRQMQKVEKVAVRTARKLCLDSEARGANDYVLKLRSQVASGMPGTPGKDVSNSMNGTPARGTPARAATSGRASVQSSPMVAAGDAKTARKRQLQAQLTAELELGCLRMMLGSDGRAAELLAVAAGGLAKEHAPAKAAVVTESWQEGKDFF